MMTMAPRSRSSREVVPLRRGCLMVLIALYLELEPVSIQLVLTGYLGGEM